MPELAPTTMARRRSFGTPRKWGAWGLGRFGSGDECGLSLMADVWIEELGGLEVRESIGSPASNPNAGDGATRGTRRFVAQVGLRARSAQYGCSGSRSEAHSSGLVPARTPVILTSAA